MNGKERNQHEAQCPRCGAAAQWSLTDQSGKRIQILCPDCGRYETDKDEFDSRAAEIVETND